MPFEVSILGSSSATPTSTRYPSAQLVNLLGRFFLIDCGEGTQMQLRRYGIKLQKIQYICISHLHGDHYLGLMGLLSTMSLLNRQKDLIIFAPKGLSEILDLHLSLSYSELSFNIKIIHLNGKGFKKIFEDVACELFSFGLKHRIPCWGFKLVEKKRPRKLLKSALLKYNIPVKDLNSIKLGADFILNKKTIKNHLLTKEPYIPRSYAYCSDTMYFKNIIKYISGVDLLYHEATFHSSMKKKAKSTYHSTSEEAALVAKNGNVKELLLGHFSSRYKNLNILKNDAKNIFHNVHLAVEGSVWKIKKTYNYESNC